MRGLSRTAIALVLVGMTAIAAEPINYIRQIKPILTAHCYACHGALQQKSGLRTDTAAFIRNGAKQGPAVVAGKSDESLLILRVTGKSGKQMPPASAGEELKPIEIALLQQWIKEGASGPPDEKPEPDPRQHWAFRSPSVFSAPTSHQKRANNPVDAFLGKERASRNLKAVPPASKRLLLRRLYLDLIGLPPTYEELASFESDRSPDAYEKVVDRLLASPHYGERWGRHWMDIWRYSDWWGLGAEVRNSQKHIWHWRDWIIESLNSDLGYDEMLREMLAGDELYPTDLSRLRATGFLARHYFLFNRNTWLNDTVEHTAKAFLGLTITCSRCHDHKYDPISQPDYYRFRAFFEPYQVRIDQIPGEDNLEKDGLPRVFDCNLDAPTYRFERGDEKHPLKKRSLKPGVPRLLALDELEPKPIALPSEAYTPGLRSFVLENYLKSAESEVRFARDGLVEARTILALAEKESKQRKDKDQEIRNTPKVDTNKVLFHEDFNQLNSLAWGIGTGQWRCKGGRLVQEKADAIRSVLRAKLRPPQDFEARCKFAITGGEPWRSVGLCFDADESHEVLVYASAYAGGPKLQISYRHNGNYFYPATGMQSWPIKLNQPLDLTVRIRDLLVNATLNGKEVLAYRLPIPRHEGELQLITFAAKAEFTEFALMSLPANLKLIEAGVSAKEKLIFVEEARAKLILAEKVLAAAEKKPQALKARYAAAIASQQQPNTASKELARQAALAEREALVAKAEVDLAKAELEVLRADIAHKASAQQGQQAAKKAVVVAMAMLKSAGEQFQGLQGAQKAPESNLETEESRSKPFPTISTGRRSALARWLTDNRHPLTARVAVNHIWARHFGKPLVATVFDFGRKGTPPTHPELLDYLAIELMRNGWSMKHLHRLMVTSEAYQMSSSSAGVEAETRTTDSGNRYYWRMNPIRMDAEIIRDSLLQLGGNLDPEMFGPPIDPIASEMAARRSLYFFHSHNVQHKFLETFDDASVLECYRRRDSIVPQQALALSNSKLPLVMADKINNQLHSQLGKLSDGEFVRAAFEWVLAGSPAAAEQKACEQALAQLTELLKKQRRPDALRQAQNDLIQALLNHNDFITIR